MLFFIFFFSISSQNEENEEEKALSISPIKFLWQKEIRGNFIFICTYDGFLHKVNVFSGKIIYSIKTGNLFFKSSQNQNVCFLPSIDGNIFYPFIYHQENQAAGISATSGMTNIESAADNGTSLQEGNYFPFNEHNTDTEKWIVVIF